MADNSDSGALEVSEQKKGRGRPKKTDTKDVSKDDQKADKRGRTKIAGSPKKDSRDEDAEPVAKRGRGRPKGSSKKGRGRGKAPTKVGTKSGRGRGRPRKQVEEEEESKEDSEEGSAASADEGKGDEKK